MKAVIQRVISASVTVDNEVISQISKGLVVLVGISVDDTDADVAVLSKKIILTLVFLSFRVFSDPLNEANMWKASIKDIDGDILSVSQFTLAANTAKANKPDFHLAMPTEPSRQLYAKFLEALRGGYKHGKIHDGKFGAMMNVSLINEGPVTFALDSRKFEYTAPPEDNKKYVKKNKEGGLKSREEALPIDDVIPSDSV